MGLKKVKIGDSEFEVSSSQTWMFVAVLLLIVVVITVAMSFYTVDANENGIVLRFGKYYKTTYPGLHLKLPWGIDKLYKIKVGYQWKEEFGFRTARPGVKTIYSKNRFTDESWMLTGDLNIADVQWIVQYKIKDPFKFLFNVREQSGTIRDVAEAAMRFIVGDRSFQEVLQSDRRIVAQLAQAKQEQETAINEANQVYNKEIFRIRGEAERMVQEARGYSINRINRASGDAKLFTSVFNEYQRAREVTRQRLYLETMEKVMRSVDKKVLIDKEVKNLIPLLNLSGKEMAK